VAAALAVLAGLLAWMSVRSGPPGPPPASLGNAVDLSLPSSVLDAALVDQHGQSTTLESFRGRVLVLVPFLTSCQEECPITTGALLVVRRDLAAAGLGSKVVIAEVTVDPERDVPSRLDAYANLTGTPWPLLTGAASTLTGIWKHFGVYVQVVPEGSPPGIDWQTGKAYTYDVDHSDGFIVIGPNQHERFVTVAPPDLQGRRLEPALQKMLDDEGQADLRRPPTGSWTVPQALAAIGWVTGRAVPDGS
jgi:cytochrome oxidase Cu insertion factor (SCO1/SenC/PrrC family)